MKRLCYFSILKEWFSAYSSPIMLITRKVTKDKRVVTDLRHLKITIAKNNLAYPLLNDTFSDLGSSRCDILLVLDLKDTFHSLRLLEIWKDIVGSYHTLVVLCICIKNVYGTKYISINLAVIYEHNFGLLDVTWGTHKHFQLLSAFGCKCMHRLLIGEHKALFGPH